ARAVMDIHGFQPPRPEIVELVRHIARSKQDVPLLCLDLAVANGEKRTALPYDKQFVIGMHVPFWPLARRIVGIEQHRDPGIDLRPLDMSMPRIPPGSPNL